MVAVCRMAPQAAVLEQRLAVGHRRPAGSKTRARRVWSPSVPAGTLQETTPGQWPDGDHPPVHRAGKGSERRPPRGLFALGGQEGVQGLQRRAFASASWPCWHQRAFCQSAGSPLHTELRQQRATASPIMWTIYLGQSHLLGILVPEKAFSQRPVEALYDALVTMDVNPTAPN